MSLSPRNLILLGLGVILLIAIPLTVFVVQKQQQLTSSANPATRLSFDPPTKQAALGETVSLDVKLDPGQGAEKNLVGEMQLTITYDATKLELTDTKFTPNQAIFPVATEPDYSPAVGGFATISAALSSGACSDITCEISALTTIGTVKFKAIEITDSIPAKVAFDSQRTLVLSAGTGESAGENVLLSAGEANITITEGGEPTITVAPTATGAPIPTATRTVTPTTAVASPSPVVGNQIPVCSGLVLDRSSSGTAPYDITFTATGTDSDGTISRVSFSFGDGTIQDVTEGGGIGTNSINIAQLHTYSSAGTFSASVIIADELEGISDSATCTQTITVSEAGGGTTEPTPIVEATATPMPTLAPTGPTETLMGIGILGILFIIAGGALLFIL